ncbi:hypothetical protein [Hyphobacterium sp.]|uniref:hypothetical protein n=1 Tax=Hyphobacterium sp. TaxID=2004662 RepID=UPI003BAC5D74
MIFDLLVASLWMEPMPASVPQSACEVSFTIASAPGDRIGSRNVRAECDTEENAAGAEAEAIRHATWERAANEHLVQLLDSEVTATITLSADQTDSGLEWWGYSQPLVRIPPQYSLRGSMVGASASCTVVYNIRNGFSRVVDSNCNAREQGRSFGRQARNTVRRWVFSNGRDVDCEVLQIAFVMEARDEAEWPATPACPQDE